MDLPLGLRLCVHLWRTAAACCTQLCTLPTGIACVWVNITFHYFSPAQENTTSTSAPRFCLSHPDMLELFGCPGARGPVPGELQQASVRVRRLAAALPLHLFSSGLGHEIFYITCLPCIHWNLDHVPVPGRPRQHVDRLQATEASLFRTWFKATRRHISGESRC
ncbi:sphingosine-1-phosphate phosphatase 2 [Lates japonicus]|uniref:Sphingosine-1-phosphate phosphatase 2 n=1 Tax=Lates japonicus TaxID=270547 RepID=A0AAD3ME79_LATJO|nr:sphingosine-1-phosphate phosphatase 2 [Lates japonicus]